MNLNNREANCSGCEYMKKYDYSNRIYYCNHPDRVDNIGKLGVGELPKGSPEWCPVRTKEG